MTAPTKNVVDLPAASVLAGTDKVIMVDISDTTEGPLGTTKVATIAQMSTLFDVISAQGLTAVNNNGLVYVNSGGAITSATDFEYDGTNLGLGVTPSAWDSVYKAFQFSSTAGLVGASNNTFLTSNVYFASGDVPRYLQSAVPAAYYRQSNTGAHTWHTAPSGTAGDAITGANAFVTVKTIDASGHWLPGTDNTQNIGSGALRMATIYAGTGTINTSDETEKTEILPIPANEIAAGLEIAQVIGGFKYLDAVARKGDAARRHVGVGAQTVKAILESHGVDPFASGYLCYDEWEAEYKDVVDPDGDLEREVTRHEHATIEISKTEIVVENGIARQVTNPTTAQVPLYDQLLVVDAEGNPVMVVDTPAAPAETDEEGSEIKPAVEETYKQLTHQVPRMETVIERYRRETVREAGSRYGIRPDELQYLLIAALASQVAA